MKFRVVRNTLTHLIAVATPTPESFGCGATRCSSFDCRDHTATQIF